VNEFYIAQGSAVAFSRCDGQVQSHLRQKERRKAWSYRSQPGRNV